MRLSLLIPWMALLVMGPAANAESIETRAGAIALNEADQSINIAGALRWRGGLVLTSPDERFGGLSGLHVSSDGGSMSAVSDRGYLFRARLVYGPDGNLLGLDQGDITALAGPGGKHLSGKRNSDAEAMAGGPGGELIVAFERNHRLIGYPPNGPPHELAGPAGLDKAPNNGGIEALTRLAGGSLLAITEEMEAEGGFIGWIGGPGGWSALAYKADKGFNPAGAATLPGGAVVVIERRYTLIEGPTGRLKIIAPGAIHPGATLQGRLLGELKYPLTVDNLEGVAARLGRGGGTLIYMVSDDNYNPLQRTLLMMFELIE